MMQWLFSRKALSLLPFFLAVILVCSESVERSMYTDGVAYAAIARNLSIGEGNFWQPHFSATIYPGFYGHPPLVFSLQSLFFTAFGDTLASERLYALAIFLLSGWLMTRIWRFIFVDEPEVANQWFIPLVLWLANEVVYHYYPANVLEPTAGLFALSAVYCCLLSTRRRGMNTWGLWLLAGLLLIGGNLSKGFVVSFPLVFFGLFWVLKKRMTLKKAVAASSFLLLVLLGGIALILLYEPAFDSLSAYFDLQVRGSLLEKDTTYHHRADQLYIIKRTFLVLLPAIILSALIAGVARWQGMKSIQSKRDRGSLYLFIGLGIAASFPLALSPKQAIYYLLPSMPYFALGLGIWIARPVTNYISGKGNRTEQTIIFAMVMGLTVFAVFNTYQHWGEVTRRDRKSLPEIERLIENLPIEETIGGRGKIAPLVSYMQRLKRINIDTTMATANTHDYLVAPAEEEIEGAYQQLNTNTKDYFLYRKEH